MSRTLVIPSFSKNLAQGWYSNFFSFTLKMFALYLIFGNIFRFVEISIFRDKVLISEFFIYLLSAIAFLLSRNYVRIYFFSFALLVFFSTGYGAFINGFSFKAFIYALRLVVMVFSGVIMGEILFRQYKFRLEDVLLFFVKTYFLCALISFIIYLAFPSSPQFWLFLQLFGINFMGDPHYGRLISSYLDPNFFGAIAVLPFLLSWILKETSAKSIYKHIYIVFIIAILLTWSRSGIATLACLFLYLGWEKIRSRFIVKQKNVWGFLTILALIATTIGIFFDRFRFFFDRFLHMGSDKSASSRWESFTLGASLFKENPLGLGYNYLSVVIGESSGAYSLDSSLLATLVNFGLFLFTIFSVIYCFIIVKSFYEYKKISKNNPILFRTFKFLLVYLNVIIVFTSHFNNIIYYQFWLIPVIAIFTYLNCYKTNLIRVYRT